MQRRLIVGTTAVLFMVLAEGAASAAPPPGNASHGHELAKTWCTGCHFVEAHEMTAKDAVPSFNAIGAMKSTTVPSLRAFLQTRHQNMPDWWLTRQQIEDVIAYITSLRASSS